MKIQEMRSRLAEIPTELESIVSNADGDTLSEDQEKRWVELEAEHASLSQKVKDAEERHARLNEIKTATGEVDLNKVESREDMSVPNISTRTASDPYDMDTVRASFFSSPEAAASEMRSRALQAVESDEIIEDDHKHYATGLIERHDDKHASIAKRILTTGNAAYRSAFGKLMSGPGHLLTEREGLAVQRAQSLTDADGGFAVPFTLDPTVLLSSDGSANPIRQIARVEPITTDSWNGVSSAGITAGYTAEAAEVDDDSVTLAQPSVPVHRADAFVPFSIEIGGDWRNLQGDILRLMQEAKDDLEATAFVTGTGTNQPTGFVTALDGGASEVAPATAETFTSADIYELENQLGPRFRPRAQFGANKAIYNDVRQLDTQGGADLWERLGAATPGALIGYRANEFSGMDDGFDPTATADNFILILGDWRHYLIAERVGMSVELVPHLFATANNRPSGQRGWLAFWRNGGDVIVDEAFRLLNVATTA